MITSEILMEKYRVQKKLSKNSSDMHDYFQKTHKSAEDLSQKYGIALKYESLDNGIQKDVDWTITLIKEAQAEETN